MSQAPSSYRSTRHAWVIFPLVAFAVFLVANRLLVSGRAVGIWDADGQYFPQFVLVADHARSGQFLRWDPWTDGGLPTFSEPQVGAFSPVVNLFGLILGGSSWSFMVYWLVHGALGGAGMMRLGRHLGAPAWGACVVALGYMFSGLYTGHAQHTTFVAGFSWLPWIIWRLDLALDRRSVRHGAEAGALWGLAALAGHPSVTILTGCFAALWALGRATQSSSRMKTAFMALATMAVVGSIVLAPTYVGELREGRGVHSRSAPLSRAEAAHNEFPPGALVTLTSAYPARTKAFFPDRVWPWTHVSMVSIYAGVLTPLLALFALTGARPRRWMWWLLGVGVLSLTAAMGESLPVRGWLYELFYPMRFFRHSAVFRTFFVFSLSALALYGSTEVDRIVRSGTTADWRRFAALVAGAAAVAIVAFEGYLITLPVQTGRIGPLLGGIWLGPVVLALLAMRRPHLRALLPAAFVAIASADALLTEDLSRIMMERGDDQVERWRGLDARHRTSLDLTPNGLSRVESTCQPWSPDQCWRNDQLITKVPSLRGYATFTNDFHYVMSRDSVLREFAAGPGRVWFAPAVTMTPPSDSAFAAFMRRVQSASSVPVVIHTRAQMLSAAQRHVATRYPGLDTARAASAPPIAVVRYQPNELTIRATTPGSGWLVVTDRWAPGWSATVNDRPVEVFGANFIYRGVPVRAGANTIRFVYKPAGYPWLIVLSWATLAAVAAWGIAARRT
jgi:hypothetical protein